MIAPLMIFKKQKSGTVLMKKYFIKLTMLMIFSLVEIIRLIPDQNITLTINIISNIFLAVMIPWAKIVKQFAQREKRMQKSHYILQKVLYELYVT